MRPVLAHSYPNKWFTFLRPATFVDPKNFNPNLGTLQNTTAILLSLLEVVSQPVK